MLSGVLQTLHGNEHSNQYTAPLPRLCITDTLGKTIFVSVGAYVQAPMVKSHNTLSWS